MKKIHYYHIYVNEINLTSLIVLQHFNTICNWALIDELEEIRIGIVGKPELRKLIKEMLHQSMVKDKIKIIIERGSGDEYVTLEKMREASMTEDNVLYFYGHTKGSFRPTLSNMIWARTMLFYNVVQRRTIFQKLENTKIDCAGAFWLTQSAHPQIIQDDPNATPFFGGNFWWAKSNYVRTLPQVAKQTRYESERWIGLNDPRVYSTTPPEFHPEMREGHFILF
jgi:hypothetical protein